MKKILQVLFILLLGTCVYSAETDYEQIYRELEKPDFSYVHNIDPGEMYDIQHHSSLLTLR